MAVLAALVTRATQETPATPARAAEVVVAVEAAVLFCLVGINVIKRIAPPDEVLAITVVLDLRFPVAEMVVPEALTSAPQIQAKRFQDLLGTQEM
jgi:hypothetical protein